MVLAGNDGCTAMTLGHVVDGRDWRDVAEEIEIQLFVERRINRVRCTDQQEHISVGWRAHDRLGGDIAAGSRTVFDDEGLAEVLRQLLTDQARKDVKRAAGGEGDDHAHRLRRIGLRPRDARCGRQRGSARGQMQECAAGKFHFDLPSQ
jgi:hypothetical protein